LRGVESGLHGGLVGVLSEVGEEVADAFLAGVDDLAGWGQVDGVGDLLAEQREALVQLLAEVVGGELRLGVHGRLQQERVGSSRPGRNS
jgi:hypothetical protein